jgi:5-formyltetrahydrofolate cyclo-ligase
MKTKSAKDSKILNKQKIRTELLSKRNALDEEFIAKSSLEIFQRVQDFDLYRRSKTVLFYLSCGSEVRTTKMIEAALEAGKRVVVPAIADIKNSNMVAVEISKISDASTRVLGIRQPEVNKFKIVLQGEIDLAFIPAIAFDTKGFRLGYGKGFFDRWLKGILANRTVGLSYDFCVIDQIPKESFDVPVSVIITQKKTLIIKD